MSLDKLADVLQDFGRAPGNYPVRSGEPRELHKQLETLAAWALGRIPAEYQRRAADLRSAAVLFILRACFAPNNTHYQVLGLTADACTPEALRKRYRALIRLTHPDMGVQGLPDNAAGIVNRAQGVLSDPALRRRYDEQLAERTVGHANIDAVRASVLRIEQQSGWYERWLLLKARYPTQLNFALILGGISVLVLGFLILAASGSQDGRTLVVARGDAPESQAKADGDDPIKADQRRAPSRPATVTTVLVNPSDRLLPALPPARDQAMQSKASFPTFPGSFAVKTPGRLAEQAQDLSAVRESAQMASLALPAASLAPVPRAPMATTLLQAAPVDAPAAPPQRTPAPASTTEVDASLQRYAAAPPTPAPSPPAAPAVAAPKPVSAPPTWNVDTAGAMTYLTELISALERPTNAQRANAYLADMKVQGSLLMPALQLMRKYPEINVERANWTDTERPGVLKVQGVVIVLARSADAGETKKVRYRISAEFWGTREGTVLAQLDLRESD